MQQRSNFNTNFLLLFYTVDEQLVPFVSAMRPTISFQKYETEGSVIRRIICYSHSYKNIFHKYVVFPTIQHAIHNKIEKKTST